MKCLPQLLLAILLTIISCTHPQNQINANNIFTISGLLISVDVVNENIIIISNSIKDTMIVKYNAPITKQNSLVGLGDLNVPDSVFIHYIIGNPYDTAIQIDQIMPSNSAIDTSKYYSRNVGDTWRYLIKSNWTTLLGGSGGYSDTYRLLELHSVSQVNNVEQYIYTIQDSTIYYNSNTRTIVDSIRLFQNADTCYNQGNRIICNGELANYFVTSENDSSIYLYNPDCSYFANLGPQLGTRKYFKYSIYSSHSVDIRSYLSDIGLYYSSGGTMFVGGTQEYLIKYNNILIDSNLSCSSN